MAHKFNLGMGLLANILWTSGQLVSLWFLFKNISGLGTWNAHDLVLLLAFSQISFYLSYSIYYNNFEKFNDKINEGNLDKYLLKPISLIFQISFEEVAVAQIIATVINVLPLFVFGLIGKSLTWGAVVICGIVTILGILLVYLFFLNIVGLTLIIGRTGGVLSVLRNSSDLGRIPIDQMNKYLGGFLSYVLPIAFATSYPVMVLTGRISALSVIGMEGALLLILLILNLITWRIGIRKYSGSI
ncbi:ABC-2 family transporter protein [Candidatus Dojkabacteria bacterium]|nr:ABC-2 family transporter protein [Candidatus Dojkabacteria bacterium]